MSLPGGHWEMGAYRYGFNGKEDDKDFGEGVQDYGARVYDKRLSKFLSVDPLTGFYAHYSPYQFAGNMPISAIDLDGLEERLYNYVRLDYKPVIKTPDFGMAAANATHNVAAFSFNVTLGAVYNGMAGLMNFGYDAYNGEYSGGQLQGKLKEGGEALEKGANQFAKDVTGRGISGKEALSAVGESFTNLENYELPAQLLLARKIPVPEKSIPSVRPGFTVNPSKFDYFFGRVVAGNEHNIARSAQNFKDLTTLGIKSEDQLMNVFNQALENGTVTSTKTSQYGTTIMKSVNIGKQGSIDVAFFYEGGNISGTPSVTTIIPKIFK
jgi:RHS repeat-associated protein